MNKKTYIIDGIKTKYEIYDDGRVYSKHQNKFLKPYKTASGYLNVDLYIEGIRYKKEVHQLVAEMFIPNPENKPTVNHKNIHNLSNKENKADNCVENLEWSTHKEQYDHARDTGLIPKDALKGINNPASKYGDKIELVCQLLSEDKINQREISRMTGVSPDVVNRIRKGKSWTHISSKYIIKSNDKLNHYTDDIKSDISELLSKGYNSREIINELKLPDTQASKSLIHNIKRKIKE